jgi:CRISPR-associated protein Cas5d
MSHGIKLKVWGSNACFTRPEMKVERVSYDIMTPSAARGILEAIYWKPAIIWIIDRIHVLNFIRFENIRRNELAGKLSIAVVKRAMNDNTTPAKPSSKRNVSSGRLILRDVAYVIEAHFSFRAPKMPIQGSIWRPLCAVRARANAFTNHTWDAGISASFALVEGEIPSSVHQGNRDLGWMLHDLDFAHEMERRFFRAVMRNGIVDIRLCTERR